MEKDYPVMIFAGYPSRMGQFFSSNPELYRRIHLVLQFHNNSREDLNAIFISIMERCKFSVDNQYSIEEAFSLIDDNEIALINAGLCEIFTEAKDNLISRIPVEEVMSADLSRLSRDDLIGAAKSLPPVPTIK